MASEKDLESILAEHEFLAGLEERHIKEMAQYARLLTYKEGEFVLRRGEPAECLFLIRQGHVSIELYHPARGPVVLETVGAGRVVGWSWLVPPYTWSFDGRATELTRGVCISGPRLREACEADHEFGYQMLTRFTRVLARRLEAGRLQLLDMYD